ncbi:MAG: Rne/Rng family ribonuclease [Synergistaceae bacterium]|jgi:ribonuclease G|nr:Rne/Rng family ribonuclease [Synergistaceae bacterium]
MGKDDKNTDMKNASGQNTEKNIDRKIVADTLENEETRVAILENGRLVDIFIERLWDRQRAGEIYKARVESVLPGINAAFVSIGDGRNAFLYLNDAKGMKVVPNQELVVQVTKTARKNKGARVTPRLSLPGRYLVLIPQGDEAGVSRRIAAEEERKRLRRFAKELRGEDFGLIVRTAAEGVDQESLAQDIESLLALWREIEHNASRQSAPCLLYRDMGLLGRVLRDDIHGDADEILVDGKDEFESVKSYVSLLCGDKRPTVSFYEGVTPIFEYYGVEREIELALDRKVWLRSGAYLVIEHTEALTVIDVNTGKYVGGRDMRHTVLDTNLEAAEEVARQLRLRAVGGIVVVDFIDMEFEEDRRLLLARLEDVFQSDRSRARVFSMTQLGLVELTRRRGRPDLKSVLTRGCPFCGDNGWVLREDTVALSMKRFLRKVGCANGVEAVLLQANAEVARYVSETYLTFWEDELKRKILIAGVPAFAWSKFRVEAQGTRETVELRAQQIEWRENATVVHRVSSP